ncbi:sensor histidine kinase [Thalassotalea euphylliae]|nr:HAMP domain-containing sensor histidine kinase [Thalassotalea euphylliae]
MKINVSLRWYMLALLLTLMVAISAFFSWQAATHFLSGFDVITESNMRNVAREAQLNERGYDKIIGYSVVNNWQHIPPAIKAHFPNQPEQSGTLLKKFDDWIYFAPPEKFYLLMMVELRNGELRYVYRYRDKPPQQPRQFGSIDPMVKILLWGIGIVLVFWLLLLMMLRSIGKPIVALQYWAKNLSAKDLSDSSTQQALPDFRYSELNSLASIILAAFLKVKKTLQREQEFLSYASHELRTPIAIIRSNCALLEKVTPEPSQQELAIRQRLQRASLTMKDMTETLLWLSREQEESLPVEAFDLAELIELLGNELAYLLQGKEVSVQLNTESFTVTASKVACRILLTNLIRNAFQHSFSGEVFIQQQAGRVEITNSLEAEQVNVNAELGFGLGLKLTSTLAKKFNWQYQRQIEEQNHKVVIDFG